MKHNMAKRYLIVLAQEHMSFRTPEVESVASLFGKNLKEIWDKNFIGKSSEVGDATEHEDNDNYFTEQTTPLVVLQDVEETDVKNIMTRTLFGRMAYEIWGHGATYTEMKSSILSYPSEHKNSFFSADSSFCIRVKAYGRKISLKEQVEKINSLEDVLPFQGRVDLHSPANEFHVIEDYGCHKGKKLEGKPHYIYFGRCIADGQRSLKQEYCVKKRKFIGNTSMDAGLSFIMANMAKVKRGDYVCDPFVGTGSLLIAAAHFGAYVTGGDISYNILHAKGKSSRVGAGYRQKDETIRNSLQEYGLLNHFVDVILHDAARNPWRKTGFSDNGLFDSIITDPPYGIRESCRKVGTNKEDPVVSGHDQHYPEQTAYHLDQVFSDLLQFASLTLVRGGRLVYWIPVYRPEYTEDLLPKHPNLRIVYNCEQVLKRDTSRRLIVMEKLNEVVARNDVHVSDTMYKGHNAFRNKYFKL